ncbi:hypothetical protein [Gemmiger formicilis]|uniref:hypothetical protein n=1 Tax=Gemmiger formicilis TaxID=745368 RepID=UPI0035229C77
MKTKKRIPLILTAALALSACASAANSATAAAAAETAAATPEPTAAPEPVGELRSTVHLSIFSNALYQTVFDGSTAQETTGTNVYKTDFSTGKTTLFYHADSIFCCVSVCNRGYTVYCCRQAAGFSAGRRRTA